MKNLKIIITGFVSGIANGLFGSGGGTIAVPFMERLLKVSEHKSHATAIALILPLSIISSIIYFFKSSIPLKETIFVSLGGILGGFIGAKILPKFSGRVLHIIFGCFMIISSIKMIF